MQKVPGYLMGIGFMVLIVPLMVFGYISPGVPSGFVNDFANLLTTEQRQTLEAKLQAFEQSSSNEITVATIQSLNGDTIENFAEKLFKEWSIGKKKQDNGILLLIAKDDRNMRIEVGYGLEGALTDAASGRIIQKILRPAFQSEDFYGGINAAVDAMIAATKGEYELINRAEKMSDDDIMFWIYAVAFALMWLSSILGRSKSWWVGGVIGGAVGVMLGLIYGFLWVGLLTMITLVPVGLIFDFFTSRAYHRSISEHRRLPWYFGGGGGSGSGGGFGGFGGGSSGGGGASGRW